MTEMLTLGTFCAILLFCVILGVPLLFALAAGLVLFLLYGLRRGFAPRELAGMCVQGIMTVRNILITFFLIGVLTALWRAAGTIPVIVSFASRLIRPSVCLLMAFLLNCGLSMLTGTSFGTAATMGVICATMGLSMGIDIRLIGGAVLSGAFFGDRCSPVSTSALLVSELTHTDIYRNIRRMLRTAAVPFLLCCAAYALIGAFDAGEGSVPDLQQLFRKEFSMRALSVLPALVIPVLSLLRVRVKLAMLISILTALPLCLFFEHRSVPDLLMTALTGFHANDPSVSAMLNGGGVISMLRVAGIVCLSSCYAGIFAKTGLLNGIRHRIERFAGSSNPFAATLATAALSGVLACNQTFSIMLTHQLCGPLYKAPEELAIDLEDTAVVVAPLVPWSIAGATPLLTIGAPLSSLPFAFYLILLPLWRLAGSFAAAGRRGAGAGAP